MAPIIKRFLLLAVVLFFCPLFWNAFTSAQSQSFEQVPYPEGYRFWAHVRSGLIGPESPDFKNTGGMHHIYANDKALEGYVKGRFPDGATIVYDLLEASTKDGITTEGQRRYLTVMTKDGKRFAETGGWGFEVFRKDSHTDRVVGANAKSRCFDCHAGQKDRDYVFGSFRK